MIFICPCLGFFHTLVLESSVLVDLFCWYVSQHPCLMDAPVVPSLIQYNKKKSPGGTKLPWLRIAALDEK